MKKLGQITPAKIEMHLVKCPRCGNHALPLVPGFFYNSVPAAASVYCDTCGKVFWMVWPYSAKWPVQYKGAVYAVKETKFYKTEKQFIRGLEEFKEK